MSEDSVGRREGRGAEGGEEEDENGGDWTSDSLAEIGERGTIGLMSESVVSVLAAEHLGLG